MGIQDILVILEGVTANEKKSYFEGMNIANKKMKNDILNIMSKSKIL